MNTYFITVSLTKTFLGLFPYTVERKVFEINARDAQAALALIETQLELGRRVVDFGGGKDIVIESLSLSKPLMTN